MIDLKEIKGKAKDVVYVDDIKDSMLDSYRNGFKIGETTHFTNLDGAFRLMKGHVILFGGMGNYGKSKFIKQIMLLRAKYNNEKFSIFTPEENPPEYFFNDLIHTYIGKSVYKHHENYMTEQEYLTGMDFVKDHFYYIFPENDSPTPKYINERHEEVVLKHGVDGCITDPFNQLYNDWETSGRDDRYINSYLVSEKMFALKHKVYKITVHHTKGNITKDERGNYRTPTVYDLHGGAMWNNGCDDIVFIHQPKRESEEDSTETMFKSAKIKKRILCGSPGERLFTFDFKTNRFLQFGLSPFDEASLTKIAQRMEEEQIKDLFDQGKIEEVPF